MFIDRLMKMNLQLFAADTGADGAEDIDESEEVVDPQEDEEELEEESSKDEESEIEEEAADLPKQSKEQDRAFAEYRRRAEAAEKELQAREQWIQNMFAQYGVKNWQDYQAKMEGQVKAQREQQLKEAGVDPRMIEQIIKNDPELVQLKQQNQVLQQQMQQTQENARLVEEFNGLIKEFGEQFPELQDPAAIPKEVWQKYNSGYSLADAFLVTQRGKIMEKQSEKAKQSTLNKINSKQHLKTEGAGESEGTDVNIPKDVMEMYKEMGFDKKQAQKYHKKIYGNK
jgi:hypothetical protein